MPVIIGIMGFMLVSCSTFGPKPTVTCYREDINNKVEKLIIFPTTDFQGTESEGAKDINFSIVSAFANLYGKENIIPAGPAILKIINTIGVDNYVKFIKTLDDVSTLEQVMKYPKVREMLDQITSQIGNYHFALALVQGDDKSFEGGSEVALNIGMFDTKALTWKWITKVTSKKGIIGKWKVTSSAMVSNSFNIIEKREKSKKD